MSTKSSSDLRARVGQLMIMGFDGTHISARLRTMLATFQPAGIILFKRNIAEAVQTHALLRDAQRAVATPMFCCVDMEGGTVDRFRDVIARVPSAAEVAESGSTKLFRKHGKLIGQQLRALGFNTDFAPCVDLRLDKSLSVLGSRTVSADPHEVVRYARAFLGGLQDAHVLGCGKHFPGLGGANLDSHRDLPCIDTTWGELWNNDLVPYREMREGVSLRDGGTRCVSQDHRATRLLRRSRENGSRGFCEKKSAIEGWSSRTILIWAAC